MMSAFDQVKVTFLIHQTMVYKFDRFDLQKAVHITFEPEVINQNLSL